MGVRKTEKNYSIVEFSGATYRCV